MVQFIPLPSQRGPPSFLVRGLFPLFLLMNARSCNLPGNVETSSLSLPAPLMKPPRSPPLPFHRKRSRGNYKMDFFLWPTRNPPSPPLPRCQGCPRSSLPSPCSAISVPPSDGFNPFLCGGRAHFLPVTIFPCRQPLLVLDSPPLFLVVTKGCLL